MAKRWRELSQEVKDAYKEQAEKIEELPMDTLTSKERKDVVMKIARRHQADVRY